VCVCVDTDIIEHTCKKTTVSMNINSSIDYSLLVSIQSLKSLLNAELYQMRRSTYCYVPDRKCASLWSTVQYVWGMQM